METLTSDRVHAVIVSPIGELTLVAEGGALVGLFMAGHRRPPGRGRLGAALAGAGEDPVLTTAQRQLGEYFAGSRHTFDLPVRPVGVAFETAVWTLLRGIPYGRTRSYGQLARDLGDPTLARAVGSANARNPLSVIVPCHRVVGADGRLVGYAGGLQRKRFLLDLEQDAGKGSGRLL